MRKLAGQTGLYKTRDNRYVIRVRVRSDLDGKRKDRLRVLPKGTTLPDAVRARLELVDELRRVVPARASVPTLAAYSVTWQRRKADRGGWREGGTTARNARSVLGRHVVPSLGALRLDRVTPRDLELWMDAQLAAKAEPSTICDRWAKLRALLRAASREFVFPDPAMGIKPPKRPRRGGRDMYLDPSARAALMAAVLEQSPTYWRPFFELGFASGARFGELAAVQVRDLVFDAEGCTWTVARHVVEGRVLDGTKSGDVRDVEIVAEVAEVLRPFVDRRRAMEGATALVFPGRDGAPRWVASCNAALRRASKEAGLPPCSSKVFRQTQATTAGLANVGAIIRDQLGHTTAEMTSKYQRYDKVSRRRAAQQVHDAGRTAPPKPKPEEPPDEPR